MIDINLPNGAMKIIKQLENYEFEAYVVGGCIRDCLLGFIPKDWDICTSATPQEVEAIFNNHQIIETGLKHGTVTIIMDDGQYEVTTFRTEENYTDNRHPDKVTFVKSIEKDLARRDFTMNAIAYSPLRDVVDSFGGEVDLQEKRISCVGNEDERFNEDGLRIMRALRFSSVYGFEIDNLTSEAIHRNVKLLNNISSARINSELCKLLCGKGCLNVLLEYKDVFVTIIPELVPCIGFNQNNKYHKYTIYDHIAHAVSNYKGTDISVKIALLLHDIGKPLCYSEDQNGGHFYGHAVPSHDIAEKVLSRLKFDNKTKDTVLQLVLYHDSVIDSGTKAIKRWLNKIGAEQFYRLLGVKFADIEAHADGTQDDRIKHYNYVALMLTEVIAREQCFKIKNLKINGDDIIALGVPQGRGVGKILNALLDDVISERCENRRDLLLEKAKMYSEEKFNEQL